MPDQHDEFADDAADLDAPAGAASMPSAARDAGGAVPAGGRPASDAAAGRRRWGMLVLLSLAELLGMSLWFTANAVAPHLEALWGLDAVQAGWLTTTVQLGFVAGTAIAAILNLADIIPARRYFALSAVAAALANASLLVAPGFGPALVGRFLVGFFLAGVYPPSMKMIATWFKDARGFAIGTVVGALTVGKALPYLVTALRTADMTFVVVSGSGGALLAALMVEFLYHDGPFPFARRPFDWGLVGTVLRHRPTRLAIGGYLGHMWELYAMWALIAHFFLQYFTGRGAGEGRALMFSGLVAFGAIAIGGVGSVIAGTWADRWGRERVASGAMLVSGAIALVMGWLTFLPPAVLVILALVWGFAVVADSAQFSALVTEVGPGHAVGTALTLQTSMGFGLTAFSIWLTLEVAETVGWGPAFTMLAVGPVMGIIAMMRLKNLRT